MPDVAVVQVPAWAPVGWLPLAATATLTRAETAVLLTSPEVSTTADWLVALREITPSGAAVHWVAHAADLATPLARLSDQAGVVVVAVGCAPEDVIAIVQQHVSVPVSHYGDGLDGLGGVPGAAFMELVYVMDVLRSDGGCPWAAEQTHQSLTPYAVEETYELVEAIDADDPRAMLGELGDVLMQVVFHARIAEERADYPFAIDDVAQAISAKLRRRRPHVFAAGRASNAAEVDQEWDRIKRQEQGNSSVVSGVPLAVSALSRADKLLGRLERAGLSAHGAPTSGPWSADNVADLDVGDALLTLVNELRLSGIDPEGELRRATARMEQRVREHEHQGGEESRGG